MTPELRTEAGWIAPLQFAIAASMLSVRTRVFGAIGIVALYAYEVTQYGAFHLADYPIFLGIAAYLALTSAGPGRLRALRMPVRYAAVCAGLMWGAVEK